MRRDDALFDYRPIPRLFGLRNIISDLGKCLVEAGALFVPDLTTAICIERQWLPDLEIDRVTSFAPFVQKRQHSLSPIENLLLKHCGNSGISHWSFGSTLRLELPHD